MKIPEIPFMGLLTELVNYGDGQSEKVRVNRIYRMCIKHRHLAWANAIEYKYSQYFTAKSDLAMAMGFALWVEKNKKS